MNVFEDLIEELKEEKLLEKTVIDTRGKKHHRKKNANPAQTETSSAESIDFQEKAPEESDITDQFDDHETTSDDDLSSGSLSEEVSDVKDNTEEEVSEGTDDESDSANEFSPDDSEESEIAHDDATDEYSEELSEAAIVEEKAGELSPESVAPDANTEDWSAGTDEGAVFADSDPDQSNHYEDLPTSEEIENRDVAEENLENDGHIVTGTVEEDQMAPQTAEGEDDEDEDAFSHQRIIAEGAEEDEQSFEDVSVEDEEFSHLRLLEEIGEHEVAQDASSEYVFNDENAGMGAGHGEQADEDQNEAAKIEGNNPEPADTGFVIAETSKDKPAKPSKRDRAPINQAEYLRRRAVDEFNSLQMVEHIVSGTEREQLKVIPSSYNDIAVSKALHDFLKISRDAEPQKSAEAEFQLMEETQAWHYALSERDKSVLPAQLRKYCETTKPALSSQALAALGRFYRNAPFSESVRSKFEIVMTRFFSKEIEFGKREAILSKDEIVRNLGDLYADWSSIPFYEDDDESDVLLKVLKFVEFVDEVNKAEDFEELLRNDFFERLREFKESIGENFYSPLIIAAVVESNIAIGNRYVEMMTAEREQNSLAELEEKYSELFEGQVSDSANKTMRVVELLTKKAAEPVIPATKPETKPKEPVKSHSNRGVIVSPGSDKREKLGTGVTKSKKAAKARSGLSKWFKVSKWSVISLIVTIVLIAGLYVYVEYFVEAPVSTESVKKVNLETSSLKEYLKTARISEDTFYGITLPSWDTLSVERREEVLKKVMSIGDEKGYKRVVFLTQKGEMISYATKDKVVANLKK